MWSADVKKVLKKKGLLILKHDKAFDGFDRYWIIIKGVKDVTDYINYSVCITEKSRALKVWARIQDSATIPHKFEDLKPWVFKRLVPGLGLVSHDISMKKFI